jgi:hypothetical protein
MWNVFLALIFHKVAQIGKRPTADFEAKTVVNSKIHHKSFWNFSAPFCAFNA